MIWCLYFLALPALESAPRVSIDIEAASIEVSWDHWSTDIDYGTGPVAFYNVHYERNGIDKTVSAFTSPVKLVDIVQGGTYIIWVSVVRNVENIEYEGSRGPEVTVRLPCGGKNYIHNNND